MSRSLQVTPSCFFSSAVVLWSKTFLICIFASHRQLLSNFARAACASSIQLANGIYQCLQMVPLSSITPPPPPFPPPVTAPSPPSSTAGPCTLRHQIRPPLPALLQVPPFPPPPSTPSPPALVPLKCSITMACATRTQSPAMQRFFFIHSRDHRRAALRLRPLI
jgi:hypothetical protein